MRKIVLLTSLIAIMFFTPMTIVNADDYSSDFGVSENIDDENTPTSQKGINLNNDYLYLMAFGTLVVAVILIKQNQNKSEMTLNIDGVEDNGDGSYVVYFGYDNPNGTMMFEDKDYGIRILKGKAIMLKRPNTNQFKNGRHKNETVVVINDESEIEYYVGNKKIYVNGRDIIEKEED